MAQFWLQRHGMFREIGAALDEATTAFREGTATAADVAPYYRAPPVVVPYYNWNGFYIGANIGGPHHAARRFVVSL